MIFLWSPKREDDLMKWLAEYFDRPVETFEQMERERLWDLYKKICPFDPPIGRWLSARYH